jgi:hypothetical protein
MRSIVLPGGTRLGAKQEVVRGALSPGNAYLVTKTLEQVIHRLSSQRGR